MIFAFRSLRRAPGFTTLCVLTLALGIGATTAIFSVVHDVIIEPLPFEDAHELIAVRNTAPGLGIEVANLSGAMAFTYQNENRVFEEMGFWAIRPAAVTDIDQPERLQSVWMSADLLHLLGVAPELGRPFTEQDDIPGGPPTVVLSQQYWQRQFGADPNVIGTTLRVDGVRREIIGVLPAEFKLPAPGQDAALYLPLQADRSDPMVAWNLRAVGRLRLGATIEQASADIERMIPMVPERFPASTPMTTLMTARLGPALYHLKQDYVGAVEQILWVLFGSVGIVLFIACANSANLFLVRSEGRHREFAIRSALGAGRGRIGVQLLVECLVDGLLGGIAGVLLALLGVRLLASMRPETLPQLDGISLDFPVLAFALGISVLSGLVLALYPIIRLRDMNPVASLKANSRAVGAGRGRHRMRSVLAVAQIALALVLLTGSGLMIRSFQALREVDPGFGNPEEVLSLRVALPEVEVENDAAMIREYEEISHRLEAIPGVSSVGASTSITMDGNSLMTPVVVEDLQAPTDAPPPVRSLKWIGEDYFSAMEIPVIAGRPVNWLDVRRGAEVALVTRDFAEEYWGNAERAIGRRVGFGGPTWWEIVGVTGDVHDLGVDQPVTPVVYLPLSPNSSVRSGVSYVVRTGGTLTPSALLEQVRAAVASVNPNLPVTDIRTLDEILSRSMARTAFIMVLLAAAATIALALGVVGIYGVVSYITSQRTREIGIRMALGARSADVRWMILRHGAGLAAVGVIVGLACALGLTRVMGSMLFGVEPTNPATFATMTLLLAAVALGACYVPARRASKSEPLRMLSHD